MRTILGLVFIFSSFSSFSSDIFQTKINKCDVSFVYQSGLVDIYAAKEGEILGQIKQVPSPFIFTRSKISILDVVIDFMDEMKAQNKTVESIMENNVDGKKSLQLERLDSPSFVVDLSDVSETGEAQKFKFYYDRQAMRITGLSIVVNSSPEVSCL